VIAAVTAAQAKFALYLLVGLAIGLTAREYLRALVAVRLGDMTPRLYGRLTVRPKPHFDPFGTGILPGFLLVLRAAGLGIPVFGYAKPMPMTPRNFRNATRDVVLISLAGPVTNLAIAIVAGVGLRLVGLGGGQLFLLLAAILEVNIVLCVFHLMPIPGLDSSRILARFLPPRAREVYTNLEQYLPLFMILIYFIIGAPVLVFVRFLGNALCGGIVGGDCLR